MQKGRFVGKNVPITKKPAINAGYLTHTAKVIWVQRLNGRGNVEPMSCLGLLGHVCRWPLAS